MPRAFNTYVHHVPRNLRTILHHVSRVLRALVSHLARLVPYVLTCLVSYFLTCTTCLVSFGLSCHTYFVSFLLSRLTHSSDLCVSCLTYSSTSYVSYSTCSCAPYALILYVVLMPRILHGPSTNVIFCVVAFPCIFFYSFSTNEIFLGHLLLRNSWIPEFQYSLNVGAKLEITPGFLFIYYFTYLFCCVRLCIFVSYCCLLI